MCLLKSKPTNAKQVDIEKYAGKWYEIARYPNSFEKNCDYTTATYSLKKNYIQVFNQCRKADGAESGIKGKAFPVKGSNNTKLKVQFFWPFRAGYWIIAKDDDYMWALVGSPSKRYFWILAREPKLAPDLIEKLKEIMKNHGYFPERLYFTNQDDLSTIESTSN
ncbi:MAG: lipocalin family protein [Bacteroidales bacterium]|jgi:apolipoprotein D and lipocalin family protein|nr:lipocalin family protein [Bacteroidales bacterium]